MTDPRVPRPACWILTRSEAVASHALIVEDDPGIATVLDYALSREGYTVRVVGDGDAALEAVAHRPPDVILLDWMLPGLSGIEVCRRIRRNPATRRIPIIMLTARAEDEDRIRGLDTGADDYLTKPVKIAELLARLRALLRRSQPQAEDGALIGGDIRLDPLQRRVFRRDRELKLGPTEFRLLETLIRRPGRVFSREQLLELVWDGAHDIEARTVDVHVGRLRKALNEPGERDPIRTIRAMGYAFDETCGNG